MELFADMLAGGKPNSLGRVNEVIDAVLEDKTRLGELYDCLFDDDAWVRMRAADALEKMCRRQPDWVEPYIDRLLKLTTSTQPSILWHLAQIVTEVRLTDEQRMTSVAWLKKLLSSADIDWIVSANAMDALTYFVRRDEAKKSDLIRLLKVQQKHTSKATAKRATKLLAELA